MTVTQPRRRMSSAAVIRAVIVAAALLLAAVDLVLKATAKRYLVEPVDLGLIELRVGYNPGVAFSLGDTLPAAVILGVTALVTAALAGFALRAGPDLDRWSRSGVVLVLAGALGNLADRAVDGVVTDYLHTGWFPTFNLADIFITAGAVALFLGILRQQEQPAHDVQTTATGNRPGDLDG